MNWNSSLRDLKKQQAVWELFQHEKAIEPQILHLTQLKFFLQHPPPSSWPWPARFKYSKQSFFFSPFSFLTYTQAEEKNVKNNFVDFHICKIVTSNDSKSYMWQDQQGCPSVLCGAFRERNAQTFDCGKYPCWSSSFYF